MNVSFQIRTFFKISKTIIIYLIKTCGGGEVLEVLRMTD